MSYYLINKEFIEPKEFEENLKKAIQDFDLRFRKEMTPQYTAYDIANEYALMTLFEPNKKKFQSTKDQMLKGYGLISPLSYTYGVDFKNYVFPVLYRLLSYYPDLVITNEVKAFVRNESYDDGFKKYLIENEEFEEELTEDLSEVSIVPIKGG